MRRSLLLYPVLGFYMGNPALAQETGANWSFALLQRKVTALSFSVKPHSPADATLARMSNDIASLRGAYLHTFGAAADTDAELLRHLGKAYYVSVADDLAALNSLPQGSVSLPLLKQVEADFSAKAAATGNVMNLTESTFPSIVKVLVDIQISHNRTISGNLSVRANGAVHGTTPPAAYIFTPADGKFQTMMPPGRFCIWLEGPEGILSKEEFDIGRNGNMDEVPLKL